MSVSDLIADQLTVIRNAVRAGKKSVIIKRSGLLEGVVDIIKKEGFIEDFKVIEDKQQGKIKIYFNHADDGRPLISDLKKISKPGRRIYISADDIRPVMGGVGVAIYSTSKGVVTGETARDRGIGGELICQVW